MLHEPRDGPGHVLWHNPNYRDRDYHDWFVAAGLALRYLAGDKPEPGELILIDGRLMNIEKISARRDPQCPRLRVGRFEMLPRRPSYGVFRLCDSNAFKVRLDRPINLEEA
ncbi:MAG: hypothetical protein RXO54_06965 [Acidilobus sp.]